ncbi:MAG: glycoside hydrolase family 57 [Firmicutes bacterium]|nr:glycoside hydrolase family 57 [Bacillota bacterium]
MHGARVRDRGRVWQRVVPLLVALLAHGSLTVAGALAAPDRPLHVALIWHMHQPYYKDTSSGIYRLPWVRMHAVKDYYDMVAMLEEYPRMRATFNLVPSLVMQLEEYVERGARDVYQVLTEKRPSELTDDEKEFVLRRFFDANWDNVIKRYPPYWELLQKRGTSGTDAEIARARENFTDQDFLDLQVWFNLAWIDPDLIAEDPTMRALVERGSGFTESDKRAVLATHREIMGRVIGVYRRLMEKGQIEVITSPFYHPILPLVWDTNTARLASPSLRLPSHRFAQPGDVVTQLERAVAFYRDRFGRDPAGLWPSEQAVGQGIVSYVASAGFRWMVSSEGVLARSLGVELRGTSGELLRPEVLYRPYWVTAGGRQVAMLFRDLVLSDRIGFQYAGMPAARAVDDLIGYLHAMQRRLSDQPGEFVGTIALDGENAWEWYANDGKEFLDELYRRLSTDPRLEPVTVSEYLAAHPPQDVIESLWTGSWIADNLETWLGEEEENRAWDYLYEARKALVRYQALHYDDPGAEARIQAALEHLYAAEGSDWFWWYGADQDSGNDPAFDALFRAHLAAVYESIGQPVPEYLELPIVAPPLARAASATTGRLTARVDGAVGVGEWDQGLRFDAEARPDSPVDALWVGYDDGRFYLRADLSAPPSRLRDTGTDLRVYLSHPRYLTVNARPREASQGQGAPPLGFGIAYELRADLGRTPLRLQLSRALGGGEWELVAELPEEAVALGDAPDGRGAVLEAAVSWGEVELQAAEAVMLALVAFDGAGGVHVLPSAGPGRVQVPEVIRGDLVFAWDDPVGDDHGPGTYVYPGNAVFQPGVFDLRRFEVFDEGNDVVLKVWLAGPIDNVWGSPIGLSVQTIDIYLDTDRVPGSGETAALGGRRVTFAPEWAWEYAIWGEGGNQRVFAADAVQGGAAPEGGAGPLRVSVDAAERSVTVRVPKAVIGEPRPSWGYQVLILGQEGYPEGDSLRVREVKAHRAEWRFGGGDDGSWDPNVIDMLAPSDTTQEAILSAYSVAGQRLAVVPMVSGSGPQEAGTSR